VRKKRGRGEEEKGNGWRERGKVIEGMGGTIQDMGWDGREGIGGKGKKEGEGKGGEMLQPTNKIYTICFICVLKANNIETVIPTC